MQGGDESESKAQARQKDSDTERAVPEQGCPGRPFC